MRAYWLPSGPPNGEDGPVTDDRPLALGCMRLSTESDRDESTAIASMRRWMQA